MSWWAIDVRAAPTERDALAGWLVTRTGQAVEERADGTLVSFALDASAADDLIRELEARPGSTLAISRREVADENWADRWRDGLGPRAFGRLTVVPTWIPYHAATGETVVVLDPGLAFGSGEHGSTRAALFLLDRCLKPGDFVLDLGSGSGILAIAAVRLGAGRAVGIEQDAEAILIAAENAERNKVGDRVMWFEGDAGQLAPLFAPADLVLSNILRTVNLAILGEIWRALRPGGLSILSGMEVPERPECVAGLSGAGFTIVDEIEDGGWWAVAARRV
jgi:ribosomal protein L11 methyltransferase